MTGKDDRTAVPATTCPNQYNVMNGEYRALFETSRDSIMLLDKDRFFDCNKATLELFGCSSKDIFITKHPADLSTPTQPDGEDSFVAAERHIENAYRNGTDFFEWRHTRLDGTTFYAEVLLSLLTYQDRTVLQASVRDITERKRAEAEKERRTAELILANQELLRLNEEKVKRAAELIVANKLNAEKDKFFWRFGNFCG